LLLFAVLIDVHCSYSWEYKIM